MFIHTTFGGDVDLNIEVGEPALDNNAMLIDQVEQVTKHLNSAYRIVQEPYGMGGEDFGHFTAELLGAMFFLGCAKPGESHVALHAPNFDIDERCLPIGLSIMYQTVTELLSK